MMIMSIQITKGSLKMRANNDIRNTAQNKGVCLWEIAAALKISEPTMTRKMRTELPQEDKSKIFAIIDSIAKEKAAAAV